MPWNCLVESSGIAAILGEGFGVAWMVFVVQPLGMRGRAACAFAKAIKWQQDGDGDLC